MKTLFDPLQVGRYTLKNRLIMAPLTRGRADEGGIPNAMMAEYYGQRAEAGLIISEATAISPQGYGWVNAPGIWNDAQMEGWKQITAAVHAKGGRIFLQLWHMGRVSHPDFQNGALPVAPSAIASAGFASTPTGKKEYVVPRALELDEIKALPSDYAAAAKRAVQAGFDGVEIHAANGYLLDQFLRDGSNKRTDEYGGSIDNRVRLLVEVTSAVAAAIDSDRTGVRLAPRSPHNSMHDSDAVALFTRVAELLDPLDIAYLHTVEALPGHRMAGEGEPVTPHIRKVFRSRLITNGGYTDELASAAIQADEADAIAFGLPFLANPDLVTRYREHLPINPPNMQTLYSSGPAGYLDYPYYGQATG